jgi:hypothetical protein
MHHQFNIQQMYALPTLYLCVLYLSENKQRLVPLTAHFVEKNNLKFALHFPMIYLNIAIIPIKLLGKTTEGITFLVPFVSQHPLPITHAMILRCTAGVQSDTRDCVLFQTHATA